MLIVGYIIIGILILNTIYQIITYNEEDENI